MTIAKFLLTSFMLITLGSCVSSDKTMQQDHRGFSRLKIAIDTGANFYFDTFRLSAGYKLEGAGTQYDDSAFKQSVYVFDSVENGKLDITLVSFLGRTATKTILLSGDTSVFISKNELYNFNNIKGKTFPSLELENGDSIVIGFWSMGCFHFIKENIIIQKEDDNYLVSFNTTRPRGYRHGNLNMKKKFDSSFENHLKHFYKPFEQLKAESKQRQIIFSTTTTLVYIRKGNDVFRLPWVGGFDLKVYGNLLKAIDPPWAKVKNAG